MSVAAGGPNGDLRSLLECLNALIIGSPGRIRAEVGVVRNDDDSVVSKCRVRLPDLYFSKNFQKFIRNKRVSASHTWIFDLIKGKVNHFEKVYINNERWMLAQDDKTTENNKYYLVIFKDISLQSIRNLRREHVPLLTDVAKDVRSFLQDKHENHREFQMYFHYMPSFFQLHLHVCTRHTRDPVCQYPVATVIQNLDNQDKWYLDGLFLSSSSKRSNEPVSDRVGVF